MSGSQGLLPEGITVSIDPCAVVEPSDVVEGQEDCIPKELTPTQVECLTDWNLPNRSETGSSRPVGTIRMAAKLAYKVVRTASLVVMVPCAVLKEFAGASIIKNDPRSVGHLPLWLSQGAYPAMYAEWYSATQSRRSGTSDAVDTPADVPAADLAAAAVSAAPQSSYLDISGLDSSFGPGSIPDESSGDDLFSAQVGGKKRQRSTSSGTTKHVQGAEKKKTPTPLKGGRPKKVGAEQLNASFFAANNAFVDALERQVKIAEARLSESNNVLLSRSYGKLFVALQRWGKVLRRLKHDVGIELLQRVRLALVANKKHNKELPVALTGIEEDFAEDMTPEELAEFAVEVLGDAAQELGCAGSQQA